MFYTQSFLVRDNNASVSKKSEGKTMDLSSLITFDFREKKELNPSITTRTRHLRKITVV
jgi:hypothetical protein